MDENIHLEGVDFENETPLITAPVGYGKSYYAVHCLPGLIAKAIGRPVRNVLMLTPTRAVLDQIRDEYSREVIVANGYDYVDCGEYFDGKVRVACFASPANFIADGNEINQSYDLVIIDEIDLIVRWAVYFPGYLDAFDWLKSKRKETIVCGLTATPSLLLDYVSGDDSGWRFVDVCDRLPQQLKAERVIVCPRTTCKTYLNYMRDKLPGKALVYTRSAKDCYSLSEQFPRSGFIVSKYNDEVGELMNEQSRDYVLMNEAFPPELDTLFINDSCSVGANIKDEAVQTVVCCSTDIETIEQVRGRVRHDIQAFVVLYAGYEMRQFEETTMPRAKEFLKNRKEQPYLQGVLDSWNEGDEIKAYCSAIDRNIKPNPFYSGVIRYRRSCFDVLANEREDYFSVLKTYSRYNRISFDDSFSKKENAKRNAEHRNSSIDWVSTLGLSNDEPEKWFTSKELKEVCQQVKLMKPSGKGCAGVPTLLKCVNDCCALSIENKGRINHDNQRCVWYRVAFLGGYFL